MPFKIIKGTFQVVGYSPDGDSIRFEPDNAAFVHDLDGSTPRFNPRGHVQLRIEAIDTLETHFSPPSGGGALHQPLELAHAAADRLLEFVGITDVEWNDAHTFVTDAQDGTPGYILARSVEKNGRPVAFIYTGDATEDDGSDVLLDEARLRDSYNFAAVAEGLAYPTYYHGLFRDLRDILSAEAESARSNELGIYASDRTTDGFRASSLVSITESHTILPKLFRRLSEYMVNFGTAEGFKRKLEQSREPVLDLRTSNFTHFDTFIEQADGSLDIRLSRRPEELVFDEMPTRPSNHFSMLMTIDPVIPFGERRAFSAMTAARFGERRETIRDLMLTESFVNLSSEMRMAEACERVLEGRVAVVRDDRNSPPRGILTKELALRLLGTEDRLGDHSEEFEPAGLVSPDATVTNVLRIMLFDKAVNWFIAMEGGNVAGVVSSNLLFDRMAAHKKFGFMSFIDPVPPPPTTMCYCCTYQQPHHTVDPNNVYKRNVKGQALCPIHSVPMTPTDPCSIC